MATGPGDILEFLRERLEGTYTEKELELIAATLEEAPAWDPALFLADTSAYDPTGTTLRIPPGVYKQTPTDGDPPWDFVEFRSSPQDLEDLAKAIMDHRGHLVKQWIPTMPTPPLKERRMTAYVKYEELAALSSEAQRQEWIDKSIQRVKLRMAGAGWGCVRVTVETRRDDPNERIEITGTGYKL